MPTTQQRRRVVQEPQTWQQFVLAHRPIGFWRLGEPTGDTINLGSVAANGVPTGTPTRSFAGMVPGDTDKGMSFAAASSQFVNCGDNDAWSINPALTVMALANPTTLPALGTIAGKFTGGTEYLFASQADGSIFLNLYTAAAALLTNGQAASAAGVLVTGLQYLVGFTVDLAIGRASVYRNGVAVGSTSAISGAYTNGASALVFGAESSVPAFCWNGPFDDALVFNREFNPAQMAAFYQKARFYQPGLRGYA